MSSTDEFCEPSSKKARSSSYCCVPQCSNYRSSDISLHLFPVKKDLREKWEVALRMGKPASPWMRVCCHHFLPSDFFPRAAGSVRHTLFPHAVPSQKIPVRSHDKKDSSPLKRQKSFRRDRAAKRAAAKQVFSESDEPVSDDGNHQQAEEDGDALPDFVPRFHVERSTQVNIMGESHAKEEGRSLADFLVELSEETQRGSKDQCTQVNMSFTRKDKDILPPVQKKQPDIKLVDILNSDEKLYTFTGIHSLDLLDGIVDCVADIIIEPKVKKLLPLKERVVLTMTKLKQNMSFSALAILSGVSRQTCRNYFRNLCQILSRVMKVFIPWPDREQLRKNLPKSFDNYRYCRIVLDCAETILERCKCLKCRVLTYSQYKGHHTAKWAIGVGPSGLITEISKAFGGRASDKFIVNKTGILDKLDFHDGVMVDKGFRIDTECLERHLKLIRPPFIRQQKRLTRDEALETAEIARARVHVERVIQRLREFKFLRGPVPWPLVPYFDDCLVIAAGLTNLGPPVMNIDKFM